MREFLKRKADKSLEKTRMKIAKQGGNPEIFKEGDLVYFLVYANHSARRGLHAVLEQVQATIVKAHILPNTEENSHKYDVRLEQDSSSHKKNDTLQDVKVGLLRSRTLKTEKNLPLLRKKRANNK